ncbi:MAG: hypothetical protein G01um101420_494 [Parcubacteria group bacterium Gr01-1014_20]|nr:MAG: hypothetical protein G01um101420_494 [Parcubacteria group bacterium Gr01-1014_20]
MSGRKNIKALKFATVVTATLTVYFAVVGIPTYPHGIEATWDIPNFALTHIIFVIVDLVAVLGFFAYFQKPGLKALAQEPKDTDKFIDYVRKKREEGSWARAFVGFSFLSLGFLAMGFDWQNPIYLICFFMGAWGLFFALWIMHDSYYEFLKKIKNFLPYLRNFIRKNV